MLAITETNDHLAPVRFHDELVERLGDWRVARKLSYDLCDDIAGLTRGHTLKVLGPARVKGLSPMVLDALLPTLGVQLLLVEDPQTAMRMQDVWQNRSELNVRHRHRVSARLLDRARPVIIQEIIEGLQQRAQPCS